MPVKNTFPILHNTYTAIAPMSLSILSTLFLSFVIGQLLLFSQKGHPPYHYCIQVSTEAANGLCCTDGICHHHQKTEFLQYGDPFTLPGRVCQQNSKCASKGLNTTEAFSGSSEAVFALRVRSSLYQALQVI